MDGLCVLLCCCCTLPCLNHFAPSLCTMLLDIYMMPSTSRAAPPVGQAAAPHCLHCRQSCSLCPCVLSTEQRTMVAAALTKKDNDCVQTKKERSAAGCCC